jgi:putative membrane protein
MCDTIPSNISAAASKNIYSAAGATVRMATQEWARGHVPELTVLLSAVSLALVFGAVLRMIPAGVLPRSEALLVLVPHLNAVISLAAIGTILSGVRAIRRGEVARHRVRMLASFGLFAAFLLLYLYRVTIVGPSDFPGPETVRTYLYLPFLAVHISLAVLCVPFVFYALLSAGTHPISELPETNHRWAGRIAATLWLVSFSMGLVIYALLYHVY